MALPPFNNNPVTAVSALPDGMIVYNNRPVIGVVIVDPSRTLYNNQPVLGVVAIEGLAGPASVALTATPATGITEAAAIGTVVATITTDATGLTIGGTGASLLAISATNVVTTAAITGQTSLDFTITGTRSGYQSRTVTAAVAVAAVPAWAATGGAEVITIQSMPPIAHLSATGGAEAITIGA